MKKVNEESRCTYTVNGTGVALMKINNPPMNALSWSVLDEIRDTLIKAIHDEEVRVIVFTGAGKAFIAGADISELNDFTTAREGAESLINGQELSNLMMHSDKPIIAAINGFCLGGGMEMAVLLANCGACGAARSPIRAALRQAASQPRGDRRPDCSPFLAHFLC